MTWNLKKGGTKFEIQSESIDYDLWSSLNIKVFIRKYSYAVEYVHLANWTILVARGKFINRKNR